MRPFTPAARRMTAAALAGATVALAACQEVTVPNYNSPNVDQLLTAPNAATVNTTVLGLLVGARGAVQTYANILGIHGREIYNLDQAEPRNVNAYLQTPLTPGGFGTDLGWSATYRQVLTAQTILDVVDKVPTYSAAQKEGVRGFAKTFMALAFLEQLRVRDTFGIVLEVDPTATTLGAFVTREEGYTRAAQLLDEARTHLAAAGTAFPFILNSGFAGFNTPTTFARVNRALKARLESNRQGWAAALSALNESFISTASTSPSGLVAGVNHVFSSSSGDALNGLFDGAPRALVAHPSYLTDARLRLDGTRDLRASSKAVVTPVTLTSQSISSNVKLNVYASNVASIPIVKNEELILLRAEANIALGNRAAAIQDLNFVRVNSGGLAPLAADFPGNLVTELLYERRYSLFFEYGHRWFDLRKYGRLADLPKALPVHRIFPIIPLPSDECNQRTPAPKGCVQVDGF